MSVQLELENLPMKKLLRYIFKENYSQLRNYYRKVKELNLTYVLETLKDKKNFQNVDKYCMFIGYPRSGHSLVGSLLDAHPNIIIAHELNALNFVDMGFNQQQIYYLILKNSRKFATQGREWSGYSYEVHHQWQGKFRDLKVIGDKKGGDSTSKLRYKPELLNVLQNKIDVPAKFIHVIRNPYDNISTMYTRSNKKDKKLADSINQYFGFCDTIAQLKQEINQGDMIDIRHEEIISNPKFWLNEICKFLGIDAGDNYLDDCANIIYQSPNKSRHKVQWNDELIETVKNKMNQYDFLSGYSYED
ncbi:MAG: sulfotransferase family protein [Cyanobacteria bacterium SW_6_48_11]|nr:MAG: sulfotransferase family protein [Cyanobacteria bacterium SW_6_48_11]